MTTTQIILTRLSRDHGTATIALAGELDLYMVERIEPTLTRLTRGTEGELVFDLAGVTFCDSSGVGFLFRMHQRCLAAGVRLRLSGIRRLPARVIRALGVDRALPCSFA